MGIRSEWAPNRRRVARSAWTPFVAGLVAVALAACQRHQAPAAKTPANGDTAFTVEVTTIRIGRGAISQRVSAPGSLVAKRQSQIGTEVTGRILRVHVHEGDRVEEGDPLFEIDPSSYQMALRQAEAGLDLARADRAQMEADLARARTLRKQNVVAQQEVDRLTTALAVSVARERQAAEVLALARHQVERTTVRAPYAGSVAKRLADEGTTALVQPQTIVVVLQETGELEAQAAIPESQLSLVQLGDRALLRVEGIADPIETAVSAVNDSIDPATRTYMVKMRVPNADRQLKAGVFAHVEIHPQEKRDVLLVPPGAIRTEEGVTRLLVAREGKAVAVPVEVGLASRDAVEVLDGIAEGEEVIVGEAARSIAPGMRIRTVPETESPAA
jgi:RND family efflux transporter MFP subunit